MVDTNTISSTSQVFLDIHDITNNIVILKNGSTAVVLTVNAMNFGLLAEQEQDTVIYSYARLLNSINYPIQILIQSQTKDVSAYLHLLQKQSEAATDEVKRAWINRYSRFVSELIKERNVLDKKFYVIIPASPIEMGLEPIKSVLPGMSTYSIENVEKSVILEKAQNLLEPKRDHLIAQFGTIGLYARQLNTQEIIQLFYTNYNPEATEGQQITDSRSYTTPLVQAQIQGVVMNDQPQTLNPAPGADPAASTPGGAKPAEPAAPTATPTVTPPITPAAPTVAAAPAAPAAPAMPEPVKPPAAPTTPAAEITSPEPAAKPAAPTTPASAPAADVKPEDAQSAIDDTVKQMADQKK